MCHGKLEHVRSGDQELTPIKNLTVEKTPKDNECCHQKEKNSTLADGSSSDQVLRQKDVCLQDGSQYSLRNRD